MYAVVVDRSDDEFLEYLLFTIAVDLYETQMTPFCGKGIGNSVFVVVNYCKTKTKTHQYKY